MLSKSQIIFLVIVGTIILLIYMGLACFWFHFVHPNGSYNRNHSLEFCNSSGPRHIRPLPQVVHSTSPSTIKMTRYSCSPSSLDLEEMEIAMDQLLELPPAHCSSITLDDILQKKSNNSSCLEVKT